MISDKPLFKTIENSLPYVGKLIESGSIVTTSKKIKYDKDKKQNLRIPIYQKPNYSDFKKQTYQTEEDCASVLFGIGGVNFLAQQSFGLVFDYNIPD